MRIQRYHYILQSILLVLASSLLNSLAKQSSFCSTEEDLLDSNPMATTLGGLQNSSASNSADIDSLAHFAVQEHNKKQNAMLELARVVKVQEQVVAGTLHHLTLEVVDAGEKKIYEAKVWVKPWMNFKELQEFKHIGEQTTSTPSDLDCDGSGYQSVPVHDPVVQDAANHVLMTLQQRSNSLYPYELQEVIHAKTECVEGSAKYDILLKVKRSSKEEKFKANVHKDKDGNFHVNNMVQDHS
ncbi:cysteine proteinase inhibitor 12-like isoform X1 [Cynara cardunculus var. scolymus]|uniref:cysteine proteinase inhibitor 12-like isoform X1 n=1 Tax=Cynara cardunculus var. scolymus TaxID=59895 RepID=UPI000D627C9E|nr:cysteine proteinase inhibitor 12-like isoform X1 [Cynara cardunculus var. scolymus]